MRRTAFRQDRRVSESTLAEARKPRARTPGQPPTIVRRRGACRLLPLILASLACFSLTRPVSADFSAHPICTAADEQSRPAIFGTTVVWRDERSGHDEVYGRDLAGGGEFFVSSALLPE